MATNPGRRSPSNSVKQRELMREAVEDTRGNGVKMRVDIWASQDGSWHVYAGDESRDCRAHSDAGACGVLADVVHVLGTALDNKYQTNSESAA